MKYLKTLGLLAMAAAALMAFANTAAADSITSSGGTTPTLKATSTNSTIHNAVGTISCSSSLEGNVTGHGAGNNVTGTVAKLTFGPCLAGIWHSATTKGGTFSFNITSTNHGTLSSSGASLTYTLFGVECGYSTLNTVIGTVSGGTHAVLNVSATLIRTHGSMFCGSTANWTGTYQFNSPTNVHFHNS